MEETLALGCGMCPFRICAGDMQGSGGTETKGNGMGLSMLIGTLGADGVGFGRRAPYNNYEQQKR